jgi:hypothetical protein
MIIPKYYHYRAWLLLACLGISSLMYFFGWLVSLL